MPRALLLPVSAMVLLASATAVLASALLLPMPDDVARIVGASQIVGARFYAAVNSAIATGDAHALREVVAPGFVEETPLPGLAAGRDGLEDYVMFLHATAPTTRLTGTTLMATPDRVVAHVTIQEIGSPRAPSAIAVRPAVWGSVDVLRIVDGMVVSRWSATAQMTLKRPLATTSLTLPVPIPRLLTLSRVTVAPGALWDAVSDGPSLLLAEKGSLAASIATDGGPAPSRQDRTDAPLPALLTSESPVVAPAGSRFGITNVGHGPAEVLVVGFAVPRPPNGAPHTASRLPSGVERHILAGDLATGLPSRRVTLTIEHVALARAAQLAVSSAQGPVLIGVDAGQLAAASSGPLWARTRRHGMNTATDTALLAPGDGLLLPQGELVILQSSGSAPVEAIMVEIHEDLATYLP